MKIKRNKKLAAFYRSRPCLVCGRTVDVSGDHIITFGSDPTIDIPQNIWPLCLKHHVEKHSRGLTDFTKKYGLFMELESRGFFFDEQCSKWRYPAKFKLN